MPNEGFVNPYTFIPIGEVRRMPPLYHNPTSIEAAERFVGRFTVTWEIKTPLACPAKTTKDSKVFPPEWGTPSTGLRVPGSSVKGSVRSIHEVLFGGCFRQLALPAVDPVPTGQVWAWGPNTWATWREDHSHDHVAGCLLVAAEDAPGPGWVEASVQDLGTANIRGKGQPIRTHTPAAGERASDLYDAKARVVQVLAPTRVSLMQLTL